MIALIVLALWIVGALSGDDDTATNTPAVEPRYEVTAEDVVDAMSPAKIDQFCEAYFVLGDYDRAFAAFEKGYGSGPPSAEAVFDEALTRC